MKEIRAIVQPHIVGRVMDALHALPHFPGVTVSDCQGQGRGRGSGGHFEATSENVFFAKKVRIEILCADSLADELVEIVQLAAHTGNAGDGVISVANLDHVVRIRSGEEPG
ncbi:MAG TPA: P-II family nitrogen regulator [Tepidisphaeraceae bacterium]|nr:P-II family nitrogen regulator [Tepidisphaeraceae bacterium]